MPKLLERSARWAIGEYDLTKEPVVVPAGNPSVYVVIAPRTNLLHCETGYTEYEAARRVAARTGGVVSSLQFIAKKFGSPRYVVAEAIKKEK